MSKLQYILKANDSLNEKTGSIIEVIAKNNFINAAGIREILTDWNAASINSNIGVLIKKGLVEKSDDGLVLSEDGMEVIMKAADIFAADNPSKIRNTRKPRGVTEEMEKASEELVELASKEFAIKAVVENRSNLEIRLEKRVNGVRQFEIRRAGIIRIFGYKISDEQLEKYKAIGASIKSKGANFYIDIETSVENMKKMIEASK